MVMLGCILPKIMMCCLVDSDRTFLFYVLTFQITRGLLRSVGSVENNINFLSTSSITSRTEVGVLSHMADLHYASFNELTKDFEKELDALIEQGVYKPVFLYHVVIMLVLPMIGLIIPRRRGGQYIRKALFVLCVGIAVEIWQNRRTAFGGNGYMLGLITAWWLVWNANLFIFTDLEHDFKRIERRPSTENSQNQQLNQGDSTGEKPSDPNRSLSEKDGIAFHWQSYPANFLHRLEWSAGLLFNMRGPEWSWRASHLAPLPQSLHIQLHPGFSENIRAQEDSTYPSGKERLRAAFRKFFISYLMLDVLRVFILGPDPYFRGLAPVNSVSPSPFPFFYFPGLTIHPVLALVCRCVSTAGTVYFGLEFVTTLNPIVFLGLSLAFPNGARKLTATPLGASWLYGDSFGPFIQPVFDHGLAGCWGKWWHQLFRNGCMNTARWLLSLLPISLSSHLFFRRVVYVLVAFCLSGFVHACGSHTQIANTYPMSGSFLFFALQSVAIMAEQVFKSTIFPKIPFSGSTPRWLRRTANFLFAFCWLMTTSPLIADEFARGGLWFFKPMPISPLLLIGFKFQGEPWWCWNDPWFRYWSDGSFWGSGIRIL